MSEDPRSALVAGLLAMRPRPAAAEFEAAAERIAAAGGVDPLALRELRWWHRASLEEADAHLGEVLPQVWALLDAAGARAQAAHEADVRAWDQAAELHAASHRPDPPGGATAPREPDEPLGSEAPAVPEAPPGGDEVPGPPGVPTARRMVVGLTFLPED